MHASSNNPALADPEDLFTPGTVIAGKYRLERVRARGGMGSVWVATNLALECSVALKVLHRSLLHSPEAAARLLTEARAAASVRHPNILQVFDFGHVESGEPFLVMELLEGEDLADRLASAGALSPDRAVALIAKVASALEAAHAKGIVHRDLKPENIFLCVDESCQETPKVVDFGIARFIERPSAPRLTQLGRVMGTATYVSPEQARGERVDGRTDVWSLCVTLYECVTGRPPFVDVSDTTVLLRILNEEPVPTTALGIANDGLWLILEKGLRKDRSQRWQSIAELAQALQRWAASPEPPAPTAVREAAGRDRALDRSADRSIPPAAHTVPPGAIRWTGKRRLGAAAAMLVSVVPLLVAAALHGTAAPVRLHAAPRPESPISATHPPERGALALALPRAAFPHLASAMVALVAAPSDSSPDSVLAPPPRQARANRPARLSSGRDPRYPRMPIPSEPDF